MISNDNWRLEILDAVSSTNDICRERALHGENEGLAILAMRQTAGRGSKGRSFFSPEGSGLYLSILLRPAISGKLSVLLTPAAAVAAARAVEDIFYCRMDIKWVNDLYLRGKKVGGILTEAAFSVQEEHLDYAVVGIGINVFRPEEGFPAELAERAGAITERSVPSADHARQVIIRLASCILAYFSDYYTELEDKHFLEEYRKRSLVIGKRVRIKTAAGERMAKVKAINDQCALEVLYEDGSEAVVNSGEIII